MRRTKIVATIGPASESREILKQMVLAGMDIARLNFSHNTHEWHGQTIDHLRQISQETERPVAVMADLQGPRIRTLVEKEIEIKDKREEEKEKAGERNITKSRDAIMRTRLLKF